MVTIKLIIQLILEFIGLGKAIKTEVDTAREEKAIQDGREQAKAEMEATTDEERLALLRKRHGLPPR